MTPACPGSVSRGHNADRDGRCHWCRQRVDAPVPRPPFTGSTELGDSYRYVWDPDWGAEQEDL